ncbi:MAG: SDR family oxidoreductase [Egibacteraceae bacterium]
MPVLVTGAETSEGHAATRHLLRAGGEVRAFVDYRDAAAAEALRAAGCKVARGALDDEGHLETALEQVHTVFHLAGGPTSDPDTLLDDAATVLSAAIGAGCRRVVWASHLGVSDPGPNAYLQACAEIEALLADAPLETVVVRRSLTYGPGDPLTAALAAGAVPADAAEATHSPLYVDDLALTVAEADAVRHGVGELFIVVTLTGPTEVLLGSFADLLTAPERDGPPPTLSPAVADLLSRDLVARDGLVGPTDIGEGLERLARE